MNIRGRLKAAERAAAKVKAAKDQRADLVVDVVDRIDQLTIAAMRGEIDVRTGLSPAVEAGIDQLARRQETIERITNSQSDAGRDTLARLRELAPDLFPPDATDEHPVPPAADPAVSDLADLPAAGRDRDEDERRYQERRAKLDAWYAPTPRV